MTPRSEPRILRLAHRGDARVATENSVAALVAGVVASGSDGLEFDVRIAADGTPVVIHDPSLARVQGVDRLVTAMDTGALAAHGIPTLDDVLTALPEPAFLDVESKVAPNAAVGSALVAARGPAPSDAVVSSFEPHVLRDLARLLPGWTRWLNSHSLDANVVALATSLGCRAIAAEWRVITPATARLVLDAGLELVAFTVRRERTVLRLERLGVRAACVEGRPLG
jgi:glycerophosphoryl diester phosphodiesterase